MRGPTRRSDVSCRRCGAEVKRLENGIAIVAVSLLVLLPTLEMILRAVFRTGIFGQTAYIHHLVLVIGFTGAMITAREKRHLSMAAVGPSLSPQLRTVVRTITSFLSSFVCTAMGWSALSLLMIGFTADQRVGVLPLQLFVVVMPIAYAVLAIRLSSWAGQGRRTFLAISIAGFAAGTFLGFSSLANMVFTLAEMPPLWVDSVLDLWFRIIPPLTMPLIVVLVVSAFLGTPLFVVLAGTAMLLFAGADGFLEIVPNEGYTVLTNSNIPAIPLFTLTGYILSESKAGERLVTLFRALFGWFPGGMVVAAVLASVFFTSFTGASGVTILALGGLLYYVLHTRGAYGESFSIGVLTAGSNIGLLFPPSLAIIIYGTIAQVNIFHLFLGGVFPGLLLIAALGTIGVVVSLKKGIPSLRFDGTAAIQAIRDSLGELLLPVVIVGTYFSGLTTLVETAAVAVVYALFVEVVLKREIALREIPGVIVKCLTIVGGVLIILAAARGLAFFIIDARIPILLRDWVSVRVDSPLVFLLFLNIALLVTGCLMDIFSATLIVAPLVIPLGAYFGIDPIHLGVIFIANLGLGFVTPPVGIDLFLASYRFNKPLATVYRYVLPFFAIQLVIVLAITYAPFLSTWLPRLFGAS